ncbi:MAG: glycosyltransferase, partial [Muribaculaceae bacterium]|nr:glycosyltransferase [Muribaculaceae bacterium]
MKISLITASLNRCNVLMESLLSAIAQRDVDLEMIVVDGASTDGTVEMLKSLSTKEPRLKWVSKPDTGVYHAINRGIEMSTGDIIGVLNAGDHFTSPDVLK